MPVKQTVLLGFAEALSAPEVAWSLIDGGFSVVCFAKRKSRAALRHSALVDTVDISDPGLDMQAALVDIKELVAQLDSPIIMPLDDASLWLVNELSKTEHLRIAGATGDPAQIALDKRRQIEHAQSAGFFVPNTTPINRRQDLLDLDSFPAIVKPALPARVLERRLLRGKIHGVANADERDALASALDFSEPYLAQPMVQGVGEGVFGLALGDRVTHWSGHRRVRMMNPSGSGSSACEPRIPDSVVRGCVTRFLQEIGWTGLFMVELLRDEGDKLWFMELNGRPWGSMALARRQGFEYPSWVVRRLLDDRFEPPELSTAREPIVCRHLGRELLHVAFVFRGPRSRTFSRWPSRTATVRSVFQVRRNHEFYNWRAGDTRLFWADARNTIRSVLTPNSSSTTSWMTKVSRRLKRVAVRREQANHRRSQTVRKLTPNAKTILFVCYGNINRSALAERHLRMLRPNFHGSSSCGFHAPGGRPADPEMCRLAAEHGIDLAGWSSTTVSEAQVESADLILAMEAAHLVRLRAEFPACRSRSYLLGTVDDATNQPLEILDPFGKEEGDYRRCIRDVTQATTGLAELIGINPDLATD